MPQQEPDEGSLRASGTLSCIWARLVAIHGAKARFQNSSSAKSNASMVAATGLQGLPCRALLLQGMPGGALGGPHGRLHAHAPIA